MTVGSGRDNVLSVTAQPTTAGSGRLADAGLSPHWWARGLALHERVAESLPAHPATSDADDYLAGWRNRYGLDGAGLFARRLADTGMTEDLLLALVTEPAADLAARVARPDWVDTIELAVRDAVAPADDEPVPADWREALAVPLRTLVDAACDRLTAHGAGLDHVDLTGVLASFADGLRTRLVDLAVRTLVTELHTQRQAGLLTGSDSKQRFADFIRRLACPRGLGTLCADYPVLARLLGQTTGQAADAHLELLARFAADRPAIVRTLLGGVDPGRIVSIESAHGDRHGHGRAVAIIVFDTGRRVVYRPRDVSTYVRLRAVVDWLNRQVPGLRLRTVTPLARAGYGWLEFIPAEPVDDLAAVDRFYRRQGALLALMHALHAGDLHHDNLIAAGETPVLVDVETLFHLSVRPADVETAAQTDAATATLAESVHRTALLPLIFVGEEGVADLSGLGGDQGATLPSGVLDAEFPATDRMRLVKRAAQYAGGRNRPRLGGHEIDPGEHEAALLEGFRLGYNAILRRADEFAMLIEGCADLEVRLVVRPTKGYSILQEESTHPDLLRDAADREQILDVLWTEAVGHPLRWRLSRYELADLWAGDVPLFTTRPGSHDVWTADGTRLTGLLNRTGLGHALDKLAAMNEVDRRHQEWIISATMATRRTAGGHRGSQATSGPVTGTAADPERLLAASCAIADQIVACGMSTDGRVNWLGLEFVDDRQWLVLPMGAGLASGYPGVAVFLAQLAELSGIHRYAEVARRAIGALPQLLDMVAGRPDLVPVIGSGALQGFGGIAYALARLGTLLDDAEVRQWACACAEHAAHADLAGGPVDWATGSAGCLAALSAVRRELGESPDGAIGLLARECAERLVEQDDVAEGRGFAFGAAGTAWALAQVADLGFAGAAQAALARATTDDAHGWCSGLAGIAIAQSAVDPGQLDATTLRALAERPVLRDLSLCHGELGIAEALTVLAAQMPAAAAVRRRRAGLALDAIERYGRGCGTPGAVSTPGLLHGLAGIGYGLLRLGFADRVPSVLLLEPKPS